MYKLLTISLFFVALVSYGQHQKADTQSKERLQSITGKSDIPPDSVMNNSFVAANGEKFLCLEIVVDTSLTEVWKMIATENGLTKWIAPVVLLDLRFGGTVKTNYTTTAKIGDKGTITLDIISYVPYEMIIFKVSLNDAFAEKCRKEDRNLQEIIQVKSLGGNKTKITSTMAGWGYGKEWDETYQFFEKGNKWTFQELLKCFKQ